MLKTDEHFRPPVGAGGNRIHSNPVGAVFNRTASAPLETLLAIPIYRGAPTKSRRFIPINRDRNDEDARNGTVERWFRFPNRPGLECPINSKIYYKRRLNIKQIQPVSVGITRWTLLVWARGASRLQTLCQLYRPLQPASHEISRGGPMQLWQPFEF